MAERATFLEAMQDNEFTGLTTVRGKRRSSGAFLEAYAGFLGLINSNVSTAKFAAAFEEAATTSDFPILLGTVLDQQLVAQYKEIPADWRAYIATGTQVDFRRSQINKVWGLEKPLPRVPQHGEYKNSQMQEAAEYIQLYKFGKMFGLTWEDIINDRLGAFSDCAQMLSRAAYKTEYRQSVLLYTGSAGPNANLFGTALTHPMDKAVINNKYTLALNNDNFATVLQGLRKQVDADGEPIFFEGVHLIVPPSLEMAAQQMLSPSALIVSGGDATAGTKGVKSTSQNILTKYNITLHVNPYLPLIDTTGGGSKTWYVFLDTADAKAVQMNFLRGHETPELFMKASNQALVSGGLTDPKEGSFEDDTMWWKVRHVLGGAVVDPRAAAVSVAP